MSELSFPFYTSTVKNDLDDVGNLMNYLQRWASEERLGTDIPSARVFNTTDISIANNTQTVLTFDSERWNVGSMFSLSTPDRFSIMVYGKYLICANAQFAANVTGRRQIEFFVNGLSGNLVYREHYAALGAGIGVGMTAATICNLSVGDYIQVDVYQDSGGALNIQSFSASSQYTPEFSIHWLGF